MPATNKALIPNKNEPNPQDLNVNNPKAKLIMSDVTGQIVNKIQINEKDLNLIMYELVQFSKVLGEVDKEFELTSLLVSDKKSKSEQHYIQDRFSNAVDTPIETKH